MSIPTRISGPLKSEIQHWTFLETWSGFLPWRTEFHHHFILRVDTSARPLRGAVSLTPTLSLLLFVTIGLLLSANLDINAKEVLALSNVLLSFSESISNSLVDVFTDSQVLIKAWKAQRGRSHSLISALKQLFSVVSISASNVRPSASAFYRVRCQFGRCPFTLLVLARF